ncbi:MAG: DUF1573 domain-containing protein [Bacteroidia bacterium]
MIRVLVLLFPLLTLGTCSVYGQLTNQLGNIFLIPQRIYSSENHATPVEAEAKSEASWSSEFFDFGFVPVGTPRSTRFSFRNTGNKPLRISAASSNCSCVVIDGPENAILPGERGYVDVSINPQTPSDKLKCYVTLITNTHAIVETLSISAVAY